ncbi:MAG: membrane protein insertion efficiency factor YidD [Nitrospirota bacterium]
MKAVIILLLRFYKRFLSPCVPPACRFMPTCSEYALEAFQKKKFPEAVWLTVVRVLKCNPFHAGGYDPVP